MNRTIAMNVQQNVVIANNANDAKRKIMINAVNVIKMVANHVANVVYVMNVVNNVQRIMI